MYSNLTALDAQRRQHLRAAPYRQPWQTQRRPHRRRCLGLRNIVNIVGEDTYTHARTHMHLHTHAYFTTCSHDMHTLIPAVFILGLQLAKSLSAVYYLDFRLTKHTSIFLFFFFRFIKLWWSCFLRRLSNSVSGKVSGNTPGGGGKNPPW